eukprot:6422186-Amphidinium_carterae.1
MGKPGDYLSSGPIRYDPGAALPLMLGEISLPDMNEEVLPERLKGYLSHPTRLQKTETELEGSRPGMHFEVNNWHALAS